MINKLPKPVYPSFWRCVAATWIDFVMLLGVYLLLGFITENLFARDAYPPARGMQLYSKRDFIVFWFFVRWILIITAVYLFVFYKFFGGTIGQKFTQIKLEQVNGDDLNNKNIILRIIAVLFTLIIIMIPGPLVALIFFIIGASLLNESLSMGLLLTAILGLFFISYQRYKKGYKRSMKDKFSNTRLVKIKIG